MTTSDIGSAAPTITLPAPAWHNGYWRPRDGTYLSRTQRLKETGPYRSAIPSRIADHDIVFPADIAADLEETAARLADFDAYAGRRFDDAAGRDDHAAADRHTRTLGPMSAVLLRTESTSSSQIEHLTAGARALALQELGEGKRNDNAAVISGNVAAMESALQLADDLCEDNVLRMHRALLSTQQGWEPYAGRYRTELVWIGGSGHGPRHASYVAPEADLVPSCMADLFEFVRRDDLPVIAQCAIAHAQFETIHPFADGNGRVGRALIHALLHNKGLVTHTTPPVSAGLLTDTDRYFQALQRYRQGDATPIISCFAQACRFAAASGRKLVDDLAAQLNQARTALRGIRADAAVWRALPLLVGQPIVNAEYLMREMHISAMTAYRSLDTLTERNILTVTTGGRRNRVWEHKGIIDVLDDYAAGLRRR